jgi:hypothetical protein
MSVILTDQLQNSVPIPPQPSPSLTVLLNRLKMYGKPGLLTPKEGIQVVVMIIELFTDEVEADTLKFSARFLTPDDYDAVVDERNLIHKCGYPLCGNDPKGIRKAHQINLRRPELILPSTYLSKFCTKDHYQASVFFRSQLTDLPLFSRNNVTSLPYGASEYELQTVLLEDVRDKSEKENKSMKQIIEEFKSMSLTGHRIDLDINPRRHSAPADPYLVMLSNEIKGMKLNAELKERTGEERLDAGDQAIEDDVEEGGEIEGYVPLR